MDVITMWVLFGVLSVTTVTFGVPIIKGIGKLSNKISNALKERKRFKPLSNKEYQKEERRKAIHYRPIREIETIFTNIKTKEKLDDKKVIEYRTFDREKDQLFKGKIIRPGKKEETIYLFQPRLEYVTEKGKVKVGPYYKDGRLSDQFPYLLKLNDELYETYVPKREVVSKVCFDFVKDSNHPVMSKLHSLLHVVLPRDSKGNYIPVNLSDPREAAEFEAYLEKHKTDGIDDISYFERMIAEAQEKYKTDTEKSFQELTKDFDGKIRVQHQEEENEEKPRELSANEKAIREYQRETASKERAYDMRYLTDGQPDDPLAFRVEGGRPHGLRPDGMHGPKPGGRR